MEPELCSKGLGPRWPIVMLMQPFKGWASTRLKIKGSPEGNKQSNCSPPCINFKYGISQVSGGILFQSNFTILMLSPHTHVLVQIFWPAHFRLALLYSIRFVVSDSIYFIYEQICNNFVWWYVILYATFYIMCAQQGKRTKFVKPNTPIFALCLWHCRHKVNDISQLDVKLMQTLVLLPQILHLLVNFVPEFIDLAVVTSHWQLFIGILWRWSFSQSLDCEVAVWWPADLGWSLPYHSLVKMWNVSMEPQQCFGKCGTALLGRCNWSNDLSHITAARCSMPDFTCPWFARHAGGCLEGTDTHTPLALMLYSNTLALITEVFSQLDLKRGPAWISLEKKIA